MFPDRPGSRRVRQEYRWREGARDGIECGPEAMSWMSGRCIDRVQVAFHCLCCSLSGNFAFVLLEGVLPLKC